LTEWREEVGTRLFFGVAGAILLLFNSVLTTSRLSDSLDEAIRTAMEEHAQ
jgi:hypothetical protein